MEITLKFTLLKRKRQSNGEIPVYLVATKNRKRRYFAAGIVVKEKDWNPESQRVRKSHPEHKPFNAHLERMVTDARNVILGGVNTLENFKAAIQKGGGLTFDQFAGRIVDNLREEQRFWPAKVTQVVRKKMLDYAGEIRLKDVDAGVIDGFRRYLEITLGNGPNTVAKNMERVRFILARASDQELIEQNPHEMFNGSAKRVKTGKTRLSLTQIKAIENLQLNTGTSLWHTRNYFLFSFYNAGIRFSDLARLRWDNIRDGRLQYRMGKTSNWKDIMLQPPAWEIIEQYRGNREYIFPILDDGMTGNIAWKRISSQNAVVNADLKKIARMAGIEAKISFHVARHSFADYARSRGMNIYDISKALAHGDIKVTQDYLKSFDEQSLDKSMTELFNDS